MFDNTYYYEMRSAVDRARQMERAAMARVCSAARGPNRMARYILLAQLGKILVRAGTALQSAASARTQLLQEPPFELPTSVTRAG